MDVKRPRHVHRRQVVSTIDRRLFITLSVKLYMQCDVRDAARRADNSASVETCLDDTEAP